MLDILVHKCVKYIMLTTNNVNNERRGQRPHPVSSESAEFPGKWSSNVLPITEDIFLLKVKITYPIAFHWFENFKMSFWVLHKNIFHSFRPKDCFYLSNTCHLQWLMISLIIKLVTMNKSKSSHEKIKTKEKSSMNLHLPTIYTCIQ